MWRSTKSIIFRETIYIPFRLFKIRLQQDITKYKQTRYKRKKMDKLTAVRQIWDVLIESCKKSYKPSTDVTLDEQLIGFCGRCFFKIYIPSKPNKYGIKVLMICDNATKYIMNVVAYLGKGLYLEIRWLQMFS